MADFTLATGGAFADGATLGAYPASAWSGRFASGTPIGSATNTQTVSGQSVTFTGLTAGVSYYAAVNSSNTNYIHFTVPSTDLPTTNIAALATATQTQLTALSTGLLNEAVARVTGDTPNLGTCFATPALANLSGAAVTADRCYYHQVVIPTSATITGLVYQCTSGAAGNSRVALYNAAGARVANRTTDFTVSGIDAVAFDTPYAATKGIYFVSVVFSGTPSISLAQPTLPSGFVAGPGSGATATSITPPTTIASTRVAVLATY